MLDEGGGLAGGVCPDEAVTGVVYEPGLRELMFPDGTVCRGYVKDGMTVKPGFGGVLSFDLKIRMV